MQITCGHVGLAREQEREAHIVGVSQPKEIDMQADTHTHARRVGTHVGLRRLPCLGRIFADFVLWIYKHILAVCKRKQTSETG